MELLEWSEEMSVGVPEIDKQHRKMISIINKVFNALPYVADIEVIKEAINELLQYASIHFATEEKYMTECNYKELDAHVMEHKTYIQTINKFNLELDNGERTVLDIALELNNFLIGWWSTHIMDTDKKYSTAIKEHSPEN